jgi:hypothetical protein
MFGDVEVRVYGADLSGQSEKSLSGQVKTLCYNIETMECERNMEYEKYDRMYAEHKLTSIEASAILGKIIKERLRLYSMSLL